MGNRTITSRGVRAAFVALAAASVLSTSACAKHDGAAARMPTQFGLINTPAPSAQVTPADLKKLDEYYATASANLAKRSTVRCAMPLDTSREGPLGNKNIEKLVKLDELAKAYPKMVTPTKAMLAMADNAGYAICYDTRLLGSEYAAALHMDNKVIALNPLALNTDKPILYQQAAISISLQHLVGLWNKGVSAQMAQNPISIAIHAGSLKSDVYTNQWSIANLMPAPVVDLKKPADPDADSRWMNQAALRSPAKNVLS